MVPVRRTHLFLASLHPFAGLNIKTLQGMTRNLESRKDKAGKIMLPFVGSVHPRTIHDLVCDCEPALDFLGPSSKHKTISWNTSQSAKHAVTLKCWTRGVRRMHRLFRLQLGKVPPRDAPRR